MKIAILSNGDKNYSTQRLVEEAKARIKKEQEEREVQAKARTHVEINVPDSSEIVKKNLEAAKNAGKKIK